MDGKPSSLTLRAALASTTLAGSVCRRRAPRARVATRVTCGSHGPDVVVVPVVVVGVVVVVVVGVVVEVGAGVVV